MSKNNEILTLLRKLSPGAGMTVARIRREIMGYWSNPRAAAGLIRHDLESMELEGLVERVDNLKPVVWRLKAE